MSANGRVKNCDNVQRRGWRAEGKTGRESGGISPQIFATRVRVTGPAAVHANKFPRGFFVAPSRRFRYRCIDHRAHVEELAGDELCFPHPYTRTPVSCSLPPPPPPPPSPPLRSFHPLPSHPPRSRFSTSLYFSIFLPRLVYVLVLCFRARIKDYIWSRCLPHVAGLRVWSERARARPMKKEQKFKVEGSAARYSSTFGSGCQGALFTGFAAERTINSARCRWRTRSDEPERFLAFRAGYLQKGYQCYKLRTEYLIPSEAFPVLSTVFHLRSVPFRTVRQ